MGEIILKHTDMLGEDPIAKAVDTGTIMRDSMI